MRVKKSNNNHCLIAGACIKVDAFDLDRHVGVDCNGWNGIAVGCIHDDGWLQIEPQLDVNLPPGRFINHVDNFDFNNLIPCDCTEMVPMHCGSHSDTSSMQSLEICSGDADFKDVGARTSAPVEEEDDDDNNNVNNIDNNESKRKKSKISGHVGVTGVIHDKV